LQDKTIVDGKPLNPGQYTVEWTGTGPTVQVTLLQGKQTVATFPAHVTEQPKPNHDDAYGSTTEPDGSSRLTAILASPANAPEENTSADAIRRIETFDNFMNISFNVSAATLCRARHAPRAEKILVALLVS
jgi:hypothetical protein